MTQSTLNKIFGIGLGILYLIVGAVAGYTSYQIREHKNLIDAAGKVDDAIGNTKEKFKTWGEKAREKVQEIK